MRELLAALAARGTLVSPDAADALQRADEAAAKEALLTRDELPFMLTRSDIEALVRVREPAPAVSDPATPPAPAPEPPRPAPASEAPPPKRDAPPQRTGSAQAVESRGAVLQPPEPRQVAPAPRAPAPAAPPEPVVVAPAPPRVWGPQPKGELYPHKWDVLADITGNSTCEGSITDFTRYFGDRLNKMRKLLRQRRELVGHIPIRNIRAGAQAEVRIIGIVTETRSTKNGHRLIEVEDETGSVAILAPANNPNLLSEAQTIIEDEVLGLVTRPAGRGDLLILDRVIRPDVPNLNDKRASDRASAVAVVSDIHMGSKTFLEDDWDRFIKWINGEFGDSRMKALARKVKYLVVNGDVVDGIGIFPGQEDELSIIDATEQYEYAGHQFDRIRDDVKVFILPGNHDMVRPAEPQPALPEKYAKFFPENVTQVGNPVKVSIEGVEFLGYHGFSMVDWNTRVAGLSFEKPVDTMREMMLRRHMCPMYGLRTPIAPEHKDYLIIDTVPDVFITGHIHAAGMDTYRGVTMVNASCWQSQTAYQKMHGFMPDPGKVPVIELDTRRSWMLDFHRDKPSGLDVVGKSALGKPDPKVTPDF